MSGYRKLLSHSADAKTLEIVAGLKTLMERAVPLYSEPNRNPKPNDQIVAWHTYGARALIDGEPVYVKLVVREKADGKRVLDHFHDASVTSENEVRAPYPASSHPLSMQGTAAGMAPDKDRLRAWYNAVNPDSVSKVVDENGEPLVVYTGGRTENWRDDTPITEFRSANGPWAGFFTDSKDVANRFASLTSDWTQGRSPSGVVHTYLSLQHPLIVDALGHKARDFQIDASRIGREDHPIREQLLSGKHDGLILRNTEDESDVYVALRPEQIKSAIGNRGAFDGANPNILESRSSGPAQWQAPEPSRLDDLIYSMQDKHVDLKRVVQSIKKTAGSIADNIDPYLQEELLAMCNLGLET
ncbi:MAG: hypothetical protein JNM32_07310 [Dechloromonas sp.]|nr:hypothetical protein [Dechloromonas sp.]